MKTSNNPIGSIDLRKKGNEVKPLYKVLDEKRTQGEWEVDATSINGYSIWKDIHRDEGILVSTVYTECGVNEADANAQYTALAVNNMAKVADLVNEMVNLLPTIDANVDALSFMALKSWNERAKEALSLIS